MTVRMSNNDHKWLCKDGTVSIYKAKKKYTINGHVHEDGSVFKLSPEQVAEIKKSREEGMTLMNIAEKYNCTYYIVRKALTK